MARFKFGGGGGGGAAGLTWNTVDFSGGTSTAGNSLNTGSSSWGEASTLVTTTAVGEFDASANSGHHVKLIEASHDWSASLGCLIRVTWASFATLSGNTYVGFGVGITGGATYTGFIGGFRQATGELYALAGKTGSTINQSVDDAGAEPLGPAVGLNLWFPFGSNGPVGASSKTSERSAGIHNITPGSLTDFYIGIFPWVQNAHAQAAQTWTDIAVQYALVPDPTA